MALLYGAGVWGEVFTVEQIERLQTVQRVFLVKFTEAYRMTSTQALNVLAEIPLETRVLNIESQVPGSRFEVFTDGSKNDSEAGLAVCILEHEEPYEIFKFKLGVNNTVFQAELVAIDFAVRWALGEKIKINIITDSQSSIEALQSSRSRSEVVIRAKENFNLAGGTYWASLGEGAR
ncbi:hypothetical protein AVEN_159147-1, partial [Araneus ventricosus]